MARENVGSFHYLMYKRYQKKVNLALKKIEGPQFLIPGAQLALESFGLFRPLAKYVLIMYK